MQRRNVWSTVSIALLVGLIAAGCDAFTGTQARLERAAKSLEEGRPEAALADARAVTGKEPQNAAAWLLLARIGLKYEDGAGVLTDLDRAAKGGATDAQIRPLRDQALLLTRKFDEIVAQPATDIDQQVVRAQALMALNRNDEATALVRAALAQNPRNQEAQRLQVRLLDAAGQHAEARKFLADMVAAEPENAKFALEEARFALGDGNAAAAIVALTRADANANRQLTVPERTRLIAALTEQYIATQQLDKAAAAFARLKARVPDSPGTELLSARLLLAQGDTVAAVAGLQRSLAKQPRQPQAKLLLATALAGQGSTEQARVQLAELIAEQPENVAARKLMARLLVTQGEAAAAEKVLANAPQGAQGDASVDWMRSAILSASGQPAAALAALEQAAKADRKNVTLQVELARAYASVGRAADAKRTLQAIPPQKGGMGARQLQVLQRIVGEPADKVKGLLTSLAAENPNDAELHTVVGQTLAQAGDLEGATAQFRAAVAISPKLAEARLGLVGVAFAKNDLGAAKQELEKISSDIPGAEGPYLALAGVAQREGKDKEARQWLEKAISAVPAAVMARVSLAELLYQDNQTAAADALLDQAETVAVDKVPALLRVGEVQMRTGQPEKAVVSFKKAYELRPQSDVVAHLFVARRAAKDAQPEIVLREWLQKAPEDSVARGLLAEQLLSEGNHRASAAEYERLIRQAPTPVALNNLAWLYQTLGDSRAEAIAKQAYDAVPNHPTILDTYGWILMEKGRAADALPLLTKAAERAPDNAEIKKHLERARQLTAKK